MKNLIIADIRSNNNKGICTGHYISIAKMYKKIFADYAQVKVAGGPIYNKYIEKNDLIQLPYDVYPTGQSILIGKIKTLFNCWSLFRKVPKGSIIVLQQCSDVPSHFFTSMFYRGGSKLYMIRYNDDGVSNSLKKIIYSFVKNKIDGIICPNNRVGNSYLVPYIVVPDYIYSGDPFVKVKKYEDHIYDFCIVGRLNKDKGCLESIQKLSTTNFKVLVAGQAESDSYAQQIQHICSKSNNIDLHLGYLSETDYNNYIKNSRFCLLNYQGEYSSRSSGVVYDTIFMGTPVIGNRCPALQFVEDYKIGKLYESINTFNFSTILNDIIYSNYIENIANYRLQHKKYKDYLSEFLTLNKDDGQ